MRVIVLFLFISCGGGFAAPALRIGVDSSPADLDPHRINGSVEYRIVQNLFEPLVDRDPKTLKPIPGAAEKWRISKDGLTYTFLIRKNAKWSHGQPLLAEDFVYSLKRLADPTTASSFAFFADYLKKTPDGIAAKAKSPRELELTLERPVAYFLDIVAHHSYYPVPKEVVEKEGTRWTRPETIVGNGAFILKSWTLNGDLILTKNPHYWENRKVRLESVTFVPSEKVETMENLFKAGQLDIATEIPLEKMSLWKKERAPSVYSSPYLATYLYKFNTKKPPFNDARVRKAFNLAIDRTRLVKFVTGGHQPVATALTPPGIGGYEPKKYLPAESSEAEAKKLMTEAGYPEGKDFPKVELLYHTSESHKKIAEALQQMWKKSLGVEVTLTNQEWKVFLNTLKVGDFQLIKASWFADYNDPLSFLELYATDGPNNQTGWSDPKYDALIDKIKKELNPSTRRKLCQEAETILMTELPVMPLYVFSRSYLVRPEVKGWDKNLMDYHPIKWVRVD